MPTETVVSGIRMDVSGQIVDYTINGVSQPLDSIPSELKKLPIVGQQPEFGPGLVLAVVIKQVTGEPACAACLSRASQMNEWGWIKCWKKRKTIEGWLIEEAAKRGIKVAKKRASSLLAAAFREYRKKKR